MFGRIALTILINNVDDHWRNHGFLRRGEGWPLSPIFDVDPSTQHGLISPAGIDVEGLRQSNARACK
jgi:serine/threonine-protein kinase HipA